MQSGNAGLWVTTASSRTWPEIEGMESFKGCRLAASVSYSQLKGSFQIPRQGIGPMLRGSFRASHKVRGCRRQRSRRPARASPARRFPEITFAVARGSTPIRTVYLVWPEAAEAAGRIRADLGEIRRATNPLSKSSEGAMLFSVNSTVLGSVSDPSRNRAQNPPLRPNCCK
jgi:hypothetical protein